jgi:hypothetical protein
MPDQVDINVSSTERRFLGTSTMETNGHAAHKAKVDLTFFSQAEYSLGLFMDVFDGHDLTPSWALSCAT